MIVFVCKENCKFNWLIRRLHCPLVHNNHQHPHIFTYSLHIGENIHIGTLHKQLLFQHFKHIGCDLFWFYFLNLFFLNPRVKSLNNLFCNQLFWYFNMIFCYLGFIFVAFWSQTYFASQYVRLPIAKIVHDMW